MGPSRRGSRGFGADHLRQGDYSYDALGAYLLQTEYQPSAPVAGGFHFCNSGFGSFDTGSAFNRASGGVKFRLYSVQFLPEQPLASDPQPR